MNKLFKTLTVIAIGLSTVMPALADGEETSGGFTTKTETVCTTSYGGATDCTQVTTNEQITRESSPSTDLTEYDTGIAEMATIGIVLFLGGFAAFVMAQKQLKI